jgi:F-type H+-transporting ATPase subunit delta
MPSAAASRYAKALVDVVFSPAGGVDAARVPEELRAFESALKESSELRHVLLSPAIAPARKRAVIDALTASIGTSRPVRNFLKVIADHRRTAWLGEIIEAFQTLVDERTGVLRVDVASARDLSAGHREELSRGLEGATGKRVWLNVTVDPELIGGVTARVGSTVYDGSVRGRFQALAKRLEA